MNRKSLVALGLFDTVDRVADHVEEAAFDVFADWHFDRSSGIGNLHSTNETLGTVHGNGADRVLTKVGSDLEDETTTVEVNDLERVENGRKSLSLELNIDDGTNDGLYVAGCASRLSRVRAS